VLLLQVLLQRTCCFSMIHMLCVSRFDVFSLPIPEVVKMLDTMISNYGYVYNSSEIAESGHGTIYVAVLHLDMHCNNLKFVICRSSTQVVCPHLSLLSFIFLKLCKLCKCCAYSSLTPYFQNPGSSIG
jgi:hypothetical protein